MKQTIITTLLNIINVCCIIYHEGLKPIFLLFIDILKLIYNKIIKIIFINIIKPFLSFIYELVISLIKKVEEIDKEQIKTNLINYKNSIKEYFKDKTFDEVFNELKLNSKVVYIYVTSVIKDSLNTKYGDNFYAECYFENNKLMLKVVHNNITKTYYYDVIDNDIKLSYNIFEDIPEQNEVINDRVYSS